MTTTSASMKRLSRLFKTVWISLFVVVALLAIHVSGLFGSQANWIGRPSIDAAGNVRLVMLSKFENGNMTIDIGHHRLVIAKVTDRGRPELFEGEGDLLELELVLGMAPEYVDEQAWTSRSLTISMSPDEFPEVVAIVENSVTEGGVARATLRFGQKSAPLSFELSDRRLEGHGVDLDLHDQEPQFVRLSPRGVILEQRARLVPRSRLSTKELESLREHSSSKFFDD